MRNYFLAAEAPELKPGLEWCRLSLRSANSTPGKYLFGSEQADTSLLGLAGEDHIYGGGGSDTINGQAGDDYIEGNAGADTLSRGADNDTLLGGADNDTLYGGAGNDIIIMSDGDAALTSLDGGNQLVGALQTRINNYQFKSCLRPYLLACSHIRYPRTVRKASPDVSASCKWARSCNKNTMNSVAGRACIYWAKCRFDTKKRFKKHHVTQAHPANARDAGSDLLLIQ